jgi:hypothetical protein
MAPTNSGTADSGTVTVLAAGELDHASVFGAMNVSSGGSELKLRRVPRRMEGANAAETGAPAPVTRIGSGEKICHLTGDTDWETGQPTAARTFSNFGLDAVDLGYPVEHAGKLILLFGDSQPPHHPAGAAARFRPTMRSGS